MLTSFTLPGSVTPLHTLYCIVLEHKFESKNEAVIDVTFLMGYLRDERPSAASVTFNIVFGRSGSRCVS